MIAEIIIAATITAYSQLDTCANRPCIMASGRHAYIGAIACPREYKLGTKVIIDNHEYFCEDRTSKKYNGRWDIFTGYGQAGHDAAIKFGIKKRNVTICKN